MEPWRFSHRIPEAPGTAFFAGQSIRRPIEPGPARDTVVLNGVKPSMTAPLENTIVTFERLISACRETKEGFRRAAAAAEGQAVRRLLNIYAQQRARFADELRVEMSGPPAGSEGDSHRMLEPAAAPERRPGASDLELLRECLQTELRALASYQDALGSRVPTKTHFLVSAQFSLMQRARDRIQGLLADAASARPSLPACRIAL